MKKENSSNWSDSTRAIHAGESHFGIGGPVSTPIVRSSTFTFSSTAEMKRWAEGKSKAYIYTRYGNPTLTVAEAKIAGLERAEAAVVASSGMAAISSGLLAILSHGDELIATRQLYGGSYRMMRDVLPRFGIKVHYVENDLAGVERLVSSRTRMLYVETPTNPTLRLVDLRKAVALARRFKLVSMVDNTFASPALQKPLELGFDMVAHSTTKYLGGHSDLIGGAVAGKKVFVDRVRLMIIYLGGSMDPEGAYLLIRGMKSLGPRVRQQCATAMAVQVPGPPSQSFPRSLSRFAGSSGSCASQAANVGLWRHDGFRSERWFGRRPPILRPHAALPDGRKPGWGRVTGCPADLHLAL
jgi:methionine-gamma-lyase